MLTTAAIAAPVAATADGDGETRQSYILEAVNKNRPGTKAADFTYISRDGKEMSLYRTRARRLVLFFFDPACRHCIDTMEALAGNTVIREMTESGKLSILAVYADGEPDLWKKACGMIPEGWLAGFGYGEINETDLYLLPEMPALYLLDRHKRVILKETSIRGISETLTSP